MRAPLGQVGVEEDQDIAPGDQQRLPQRLALAAVGPERRRDVAGPVHDRAGARSHFGGRVSGVGVDDDELVHQVRVRYQRPEQGADHACYRPLLVPGRYHDADLATAALLGLQQFLDRPVPPV